MPTLDAQVGTGSSGQPEFRLTYRINRSDRDPKRIILKRLRALHDFPAQRIPVYYSFHQGGPRTAAGIGDDAVRDRSPSITIIAAPGVSVELVNFPDAYIPSEAVPRVDIVRVQSPRLVPTIGAPSSTTALLPEYFVDTDPGTLPRPGQDPDEASAEGTGSSSTGPEDEAIESATSSPIDDMFDSRTATSEEVSAYLNPFRGALMRRRRVREEFALMRLLQGGSPMVYTEEFESPPSYLQITRRADGVTFTHPYSSQALDITVSTLFRTTSMEPRADHEDRFAYRINRRASNPGGLVMPLVTVVKTANVKATLTSTVSGRVVGADTLRERLRTSAVFFDVYDADFQNIPAQGGRLATQRLPRSTVRVQPDPLFELGTALVDLAIGFIPFVGDFADVSELVYACSTDRDRWGRHVSTLDKVVLGLGVVLPLVGSGVMRAAPRVAEAFGRLRGTTRRLAAGLEEARYTADEQRELLQAYEVLRDGNRLTPSQASRVAELLQRMPRCRA